MALYLLSLVHSTVSSSVNALAAVTIEDLIKPYTHMSEKHLSWTSKGLSECIISIGVFAFTTELRELYSCLMIYLSSY